MGPFDRPQSATAGATRQQGRFEGRWSLSRKIDDRLQGQMLQASGTALIQPSPQGLMYSENLLLELPGQAPMQATRSYIWKAAGDGQFDVFFQEGRFFHNLDARGEAWAASHDCHPDRYDVVYDFGEWPEWQARWRVSGPRKSYEMVSTYSPESR